MTMQHLCPHQGCKYIIKGKRDERHHMIFEHDAYSDNRDIIQAAEDHLETTEERVEWLMRRSLACRSSDVILICEYYRRWDKLPNGRPLFVYDADTGDYVARAKPREWVRSFSGYESIRRARESIQNPEIQKKDEGKPYDERLLPSPEVEAIRGIRAKGIKRFYASRKMSNADWLGDKFISGR